MEKKQSRDPAFLFYDGDAARDVSHLNRLERGCYFDLIQAQRKFGRMEETLIKKILGKDFDSCWGAIKICLTYDNHMYFIDWLEESAIKRREYSESRRNNRLGIKPDNISKSYEQHMENENENEIKDVKEKTKASGFKPPTTEEVRFYCKERNNSINPVAFVSHYETVDWMRGKSKIKNWKACVITWEQREQKGKPNAMQPLEPLR